MLPRKNILLISLSNKGGGASKIVSELFSGLQKSNLYKVELLIFEGISGENIFFVNSNLFHKLIFSLKNQFVKLLYCIFDNANYQSINIFPSRLLRIINSSDADIVHLHWIGAEMISICQIAKINKKVIWTMHDAWPMNGSCHINPKEYNSNYIITNSLSEKSISFLDLLTINRKIKYLANKKILFTSPSGWLIDKYKFSFYNKNYTNCILVPNFINLTIWKCLEKKYARELLGISTTKKILIYGAGNLNKSYNKGFHFIIEMCKKINPNEFAFIFFGNADKGFSIDPRFEVFLFNQIENDQKLVEIYSAGDITIVPSYSESFSMISLESISCNTPVVAFNTSGIKEIVVHKKNGYLAKKFELDDLLFGIEWLLNNPILNVQNSISKFSKESVIPQYCEIYNTLD